MKVRHCFALALAALFGGTGLTYWYMQMRSNVAKFPAAVEVRTVVPPLITTSRPVMRTFPLLVPWIGTVEAQHTVSLIALVAGRVEAIDAADQGRVKKGGLVARLSGPRITGQQAGFAAQIASLQSRLDLARQKVERLKMDLKAQLVTKDQLAAAQGAQIKLATQLRETRLQRETLESQVRIRAPMDGIFTGRRIVRGQDINPGQVIGEIIDPTRLRITASLFPPPGVDLQGKKAAVRLERNRTLSSLVRSVLPQAGKTGAVRVWIEGAQIDRQLRPGQTVEGNIILAIGPPVPAVPESAIVYDAADHPLIFIQQDGTYESRRVQLGLIQEGWVAVLSGLKAHQSVVTQGAYELFYRRFNEQFKAQD